jgi:sortase A
MGVQTRPAGALPTFRAWMRSRRINKWRERDLRRSGAIARPPLAWGAVSVVGRGLIGSGLLLFGFVAYQLWGTGIETARSQRALSTEFEQLLVEPPTTVPTTPSVTEPEDPTTSPAPIPTRLVNLGDPIARIEIPKISVDGIVVAGVGSAELQLGPGHFPDTVPPGHLGNSAIAGHRTSYGQPFRNVDRLEPGDEIRATTPEGTFVYRVTQTRIVSPSDYFVVFTTNAEEAQMTLVSCHPIWSTAQRIVVSATLAADESSPVLAPRRYQVSSPGTDLSEFSPPSSATTPDTFPTPVETTEPGREPFTEGLPLPIRPVLPGSTSASTGSGPGVIAPLEITDAFSDGWFYDRDAFPQIVLWGIFLILISTIAYVISVVKRGDLFGFGVGILPFLMALYFFFQNLQRLVPPGL